MELDKLENAKQKLEEFIGIFYEFPNPTSVSIRDYEVTAIETVLKALDNYIPKEKVEKIEKYCKTKSKFQTFGDEQLERAIEMYVNKTKKDVLSLLEE